MTTQGWGPEGRAGLRQSWEAEAAPGLVCVWDWEGGLRVVFLSESKFMSPVRGSFTLI